jgi:hypothetical protein
VTGAAKVIGAALAVAALATSKAQAQQPRPDPLKTVDTLKDLGAALRTCWVPPPLERSHPGMQITVQMSFRRDGVLFGQPRITFESADASDDDRLAYRIALAEMLKRCSPLRFTEGLGNAVAGRPFTMRFIDNRKLKQATLEQANSNSQE